MSQLIELFNEVITCVVHIFSMLAPINRDALEYDCAYNTICLALGNG